MPRIRAVAWAVQPGATGLTRPDRLVRELSDLGVIESNAERIFHGRSDAVSGTVRAPKLWPARGVRDVDDVAVMSPLFLLTRSRRVAWIDLYDDWSLAPDINRLYRAYAGRGYASLRRGAHAHAVITTNSAAMAERIGAPASAVVPNGVDVELADLARGEDDRSRLVVLGHFFQGRTDFNLLERVLTSPRFSEVHIGGPGTDPIMQTILTAVNHAHAGRLVIHDRIDEAHLADLAGPNTVALIPNLVSPYTISQDPMKAYTFEAIGIPVISRREVWPSTLPNDSRHLLLDRGDDVDSRLSKWMPNRATDDERAEFVRSNSWRRRAEAIAERLR